MDGRRAHYSLKFLLIVERGREREILVCCSTYLCIHWLILVFALIGDQTQNLAILSQCCNHLSYLARATLFSYLALADVSGTKERMAGKLSYVFLGGHLPDGFSPQMGLPSPGLGTHLPVSLWIAIPTFRFPGILQADGVCLSILIYLFLTLS